MDDAEREGFFISPSPPPFPATHTHTHSQNVLSQFWAGFHMGIQRCSTLLIRLLCQVPAPSVPGCSTGRTWVGGGGGCRVGDTKAFLASLPGQSVLMMASQTLGSTDAADVTKTRRRASWARDDLLSTTKMARKAWHQNPARPRAHPLKQLGGLLKRLQIYSRDGIRTSP